MKRAVTYLELIFIITIIAILSYSLLSYSTKSINTAQITKLRSQIALIRNAIENNYMNRVMLNPNSGYIQKLDDAPSDVYNRTLFNGYNEDMLLDAMIFSVTEANHKIGEWIKLDDRRYKVYMTNSEYVIFTYDSKEGRFDCDFKNSWCKELSQ